MPAIKRESPWRRINQEVHFDLGPARAGNVPSPYQDGIIVDPGGGGDYTTIQEALDANSSGGKLFLIGPGTYIDDTINFTAHGQTIRGVDLTAKQIVTAADAQICDFGAYTGCRIENMRLEMTNPTTAKDLISGSGQLRLRWCHLTVNVSQNIGTVLQPSVLNTTGDVKMRFGIIDYDHTGSQAGCIKAPILLGAGASIELDEVSNIDVDCSGTALATTLAYGASTGGIQIERCQIDVDDVNATFVVGLAYLAGSGTDEFRSNDIHVTGNANTAYGLLLTTGTTLSIRTIYNHIYVLAAAGTARSFSIGAGVTLESQLDDIIAADGYINNGTFTFANSQADGEADFSGMINVPQIRALDATGLGMYDDGGNGIFVEDGGDVGIDEFFPGSKLSVHGGAAIGACYSTETAPTDGLMIEGDLGVGVKVPGSKFGVAGGVSIGTGYAETAAPNNGIIIEGNVGIGTPGPNYLLHLNSSNPRIGLEDTDGGDVFVLQNANGVFRIKNDTYDRTDFQIDGDGNVGIGTTDPDRLLHAEVSDSATNAITYAQRLSHISEGTVVTGFGTGLEFELEENDGTNKVAGTIDAIWTDAGEGVSADADLIFKLMENDAAAAERARITSGGDFKIPGDYYSGGSQGKSGILTLDDDEHWRITLTFAGGILVDQTTGASVGACAVWIEL